VALLTVVQIGKVGAFLDWGLEKDLFLPFREQTRRVRKGETCLVALYIDKSERLCATMNVYPYLRTDSPYKKDDHVKGTIYETSKEFGVFVAVDNCYSALIPRRECFGELPVGKEVEARVTEVKEDGKLNLTMQKPIKMQIRENAEMILNIIDSYNGVLPFNDKADSKVIEKEFGISKRAFKTAVGKLLKDGKIRITEKNIEILSEEERAELAKKGTTKADVVKRAKPETKKPVSRRSPEPVPDRKGTVKFTRSNGGRRNNRKALMAELSEMDEE